MFCQFCGVALPKRTKYCKHCGAQLTATKEASGTELLERREDQIYEWLVRLALWGLGLILGGMLLMKKMQFRIYLGLEDSIFAGERNNPVWF
jgi:hypothetical protein